MQSKCIGCDAIANNSISVQERKRPLTVYTVANKWLVRNDLNTEKVLA